MSGFRVRWCTARCSAGSGCTSSSAFPAPLEPSPERLYLDNYFSIGKAKRDLGYEPLFNTEQATRDCMPYYTDLFDQMQKAAGKDSSKPTPVA